MPDIYAYCNFRYFLRDYYEERKKVQPSFSYQFFANKAGFKSKSFIFNLIAGKKALSKSALFAIAQAMDLNKPETAYFEALVNFNQSKCTKERMFYFEHIQSFTKNKAIKQLRRDQFDYFSKWYLPVLREIVTFVDFQDDYKLLANALNPPISAVQAKNGVKLLVELNLIERLPSGKYQQTDEAITSGDEMRSLAVIAFQKENMRLASDALERFDRHVRDISTLTFGTTQSGVHRITEELVLFRRKIADLVIQQEQSIDRVYQINFQLFPLSALPHKG